MRKAAPILAAIALAVVATVRVAAGAPRANAVSCGTLSLGPGALVRHTDDGAACLLRAYERHCTAARYRLSVFGVDTIAVRTFDVVSRSGGCEVAVGLSFRVVPQTPRPLGHGFCRTLRRQGASVSAVGCSGGGLPATVSLTSVR